MPQIKEIDDKVIKIMDKENYDAGIARNKRYEESKKRIILTKHLIEYKKKYDLKFGDPLLTEISDKIDSNKITTK